MVIIANDTPVSMVYAETPTQIVVELLGDTAAAATEDGSGLFADDGILFANDMWNFGS